jgi:hypothetical protein
MTWDGVVASKNPMSNIKAIIDFSGYAGGDLGPLAQTIHDQMTANAAVFPSPPVTMAALQTLITTFIVKVGAKSSHATADTIAYHIARNDLETALHDIGVYVNSLAKGDATIVNQSAFPSYGSLHPTSTALPAGPQNLRLSHGSLSGTIIARYHPQGAHSMNEVQTCTGDPTVAANWTHYGMFGGGKATLGGFTVGGNLFVRVRTAGLKGAMGPWSDLAMITVI